MFLIHTADLHLGAPLERFPSETAALRRKELFSTFLRMIDYAEEYGIRAFLIAGDLFDAENVSASTVQSVMETVAAHPAIDFYYLSGNHDERLRYTPPKNLHTFGKDFAAYSLGEGITLYGAEAPSKARCERFSPKESDVNIVMLHGQVASGDFSGHNLNLRALQGKHIDYLALGHIHSHTAERLDVRGQYVYPGTPEPRGFDEAGTKGFSLLKIDHGRVEERFVPFSLRSVHILDLSDLSAENESRVYALAEERLSALPDKDIVRLLLSPDVPLSPVAARALLSRFFYGETKEEEKTAVTADAEEYLNELSLRGEFVRLVLASDLSDEEKNDILHYGLSALGGEEGESL